MLYQLSYARAANGILAAAASNSERQATTATEYAAVPGRGVKSHRPAVS